MLPVTVTGNKPGTTAAIQETDMHMTHRLVLALAIGAAVSASHAQASYPERPLTLVGRPSRPQQSLS